MGGGKFWAGDRRMDPGDRTEALGLMRVGERLSQKTWTVGQIAKEAFMPGNSPRHDRAR